MSELFQPNNKLYEDPEELDIDLPAEAAEYFDDASEIRRDVVAETLWNCLRLRSRNATQFVDFQSPWEREQLVDEVCNMRNAVFQLIHVTHRDNDSPDFMINPKVAWLILKMVQDYNAAIVAFDLKLRTQQRWPLPFSETNEEDTKQVVEVFQETGNITTAYSALAKQHAQKNQYSISGTFQTWWQKWGVRRKKPRRFKALGFTKARRLLRLSDVSYTTSGGDSFNVTFPYDTEKNLRKGVQLDIEAAQRGELHKAIGEVAYGESTFDLRTEFPKLFGYSVEGPRPSDYDAEPSLN